MAPFYFSNSSSKVFADCPRKLYFQNLWGGTGLSTPFVDDDLLYGSALHDLIPELWAEDLSGLASARLALQNTLLLDAGWEPRLAPADRVEKAHEWGRMLEAHAYVLVRHTLPMLRAQYRLVQAEVSEIKWLGSDAALLAKPDTLLEPIHGDGLTYLEWKSAASFTDEWRAQWHDNPQAWTGAITARESRNDIKCFRVCGILKGSESTTEQPDGTKVRWRNSPLLWAYKKDPQVVQSRALKVDQTSVVIGGETWSWAGTTAKGWECKSTDEVPGGLIAWVSALPMEVITAQTTLTDPFIIDWELCEEWLENQRTMIHAVEALKIEQAHPECVQGDALRRYFPRQLHLCHAGRYGKSCAMAEVCKNPIVGKHPLDYGYIKRVSHHSIEREAQK